MDEMDNIIKVGIYCGGHLWNGQPGELQAKRQSQVSLKDPSFYSRPLIKRCVGVDWIMYLHEWDFHWPGLESTCNKRLTDSTLREQYNYLYRAAKGTRDGHLGRTVGPLFIDSGLVPLTPQSNSPLYLLIPLVTRLTALYFTIIFNHCIILYFVHYQYHHYQLSTFCSIIHE